MIFGQVFGALAGGDHLEAAGARPIDHLADERRLVAVGQRIDQARRRRFARHERPGERIGFHVDHDHVPARLAGQARMAQAGAWIAGGFDHHVEPVGPDQRLGIVGNVSSPALTGFA